MAPRFRLLVVVYLTGDNGVARGILRDLGPERMFVECAVTFPLGSRIWVTFVEESAGYELSVLAEVVSRGFIGSAGPSATITARRMGLRVIQFDAKGSDLGLLGGRVVEPQ